MDKPILYTTGCPRCKVLKKKLDNAGIDVVICDDVNVMLDKNIIYVPVLEINGELLDFEKANKWVGEQSAN